MMCSIVGLLALSLITASSTNAEKFVFNYLTDTVYVSHDDFRSFIKNPWKCVITNEKGDLIEQLWFNRDGTIKAIGTMPDAQGCYSLSIYVKDGKYYDHIVTGARLDANGELETFGTRQTNQLWKIPNPKYRNVPEKLRHNITTHVDRYGNWIYAGEPYRDGVLRKIYYYDDGYNADEDKWLDGAIASGIKWSKEADAFKPSYIIVFIVARTIQIIWLLLVIYLVSLLVKRRWAYGLFDKWAKAPITPAGFFCKAQLYGIIPVLLLFAPSFLIFGKLLLRETSADVVTWSWVMIGSLFLCLAWCYAVVLYKSRMMPKRMAAAIVGFGVWSILALVALIAIIVVLVWVAIVLAFLGFGLSAAIGGFIKGGVSVGVPSGGSMGADGAGDADNGYEPMLDPYNGDDGGVLEGTSRVPLRNNGDGTMTDNQGRLYAVDGDRVRRL